MCTVTLSYNENDSAAVEKLAVLLNTGLFVKVDEPKDLDIDYSDSSLFEDDGKPLPYEKEYYTPEELRTFLVNDLKESYGIKDAL